MTDRPKRPRDPNQLAKLIADIATGSKDDSETSIDFEGQRKGGARGADARARKLTPEERSEIAKIAAQARWKKG